MTAHEGSEHAEQAERRDIGDATLEQMRADVVRLSRSYLNEEPFPLFLEMRRVRDRMLAGGGHEFRRRDDLRPGIWLHRGQVLGARGPPRRRLIAWAVCMTCRPRRAGGRSPVPHSG